MSEYILVGVFQVIFGSMAIGISLGLMACVFMLVFKGRRSGAYGRPGVDY